MFNYFKSPYMDAADDLGGSDESLIDEGHEENVDLKDGEKGTGEVDSQTNEKPKQDRDTNEQFKAARVAAEQQSKALQAKQDTFAKKYGYNTFEEMEQAQAAQEAEEQRQAYQAKGIDPDAVNELIESHPVFKQAQEITLKSRIATEKAAIANEPFYKDVEKDIDSLLAINPNLPIKAVYDHIVGQNIKTLLAKASSDTTKRTIADIFDKKSRGLSDVGDNGGENEVELTPEGQKMAAAFGNDPKEIAKYVKKQIRR